MTALSAEPFDCHVCRRRIGPRRVHCLVEAVPTGPGLPGGLA